MTDQAGIESKPKRGRPAKNTLEMETPVSTRGLLSNQPKVRIIVHETDDKSAPRECFVGINGYPFHIRRGVEVEVPEDVVKILAESKRTVYTPKQVVIGGVSTLKNVAQEVLAFPYSRV